MIEGAEAASVASRSSGARWRALRGKGAERGDSRHVAQFQDQRVQRDGLLNVAPDQHGDFVDLRTALRIQANCTLAASASSSRRMS